METDAQIWELVSLFLTAHRRGLLDDLVLPTSETLARWKAFEQSPNYLEIGEWCQAPYGCQLEVDGTCPHGCLDWLFF